MQLKKHLLCLTMCIAMASLSCGLSNTINEIGKISSAINEEFGHNTSVNVQWNNNVSSWTITFNMYDANAMEHELLGKEAEAVYEFLLDEFEKAAEQDFIIIRFTSSVLFDEATRDFAEFRFEQ